MLETLKRMFAVILSFLQMLVFNVGYGEYVEPQKTPGKPTEIINDISGDTPLADSIKYASQVSNKAQAYYIDAERSAYAMENANAVLTHTLNLRKNSATLADKEGNAYVADSFDSFYEQDGYRHYFSTSKDDGRVNTIRLGEYYYECHVRDFDADSKLFKVDKTYHLFGDRLYAQYSLFAGEATTDLENFGSEITLYASTVKSVQVKDKNGVHNDLNTIDYASVEYAAFDIDGVGVVGFIVPSDGSTKETVVEQFGDTYYVRQYAAYTAGTGINKNDETGGYDLNCVTFGFRIYTDDTHSFDGVAKAAYLERNPLEGITVNGGSAEGAYIGYDALRGTYTFSMKGVDFNWAYKNPDYHFSMPVSITCDGDDREIYVRTNGSNGCLEAGAILDDAGRLVPINVEVCKNFQGDGGEPFYSIKDYQYGDCFFPLSLKADEKLDFTVLNVYQNWGHAPLKQLSSIEFHVSYYHLSTGTTESNCIAPYYVYDKEGFYLPDFRTRSGIMWAEQPQFNSVGILKFVQYNKRTLGINSGDVVGEYKNAQIDSVGFNYSDITTDFVSDCGSYTYTLRHVEFPQTDENRTYYEVEIDFNREITFDNFKRDFDLFYFDGRFVNFNKLGYLDADNNCKVAQVGKGKDIYYTLGNDSPYFSFFDVTEDTMHQVDAHFGCNFALIVKDSEIMMDGEKQDIDLAVHDDSTKNLTVGCLTLDAEEITFMPGDSIKLNLVLLPWGQGTEKTDDQVRAVREDSGLKPVTVTAVTGEVEDDALVPTVRAENGVAEVVVTGGRNYNVIRFSGYEELECPDIYVKNGNEWVNAGVSSANGYDGYTVHYNEDGTYGFSFTYFTDSPDTVHSFRIVQQ